MDTINDLIGVTFETQSAEGREKVHRVTRARKYNKNMNKHQKFSVQMDVGQDVPAQEKLEENEGHDWQIQKVTTFDDTNIKHTPDEIEEKYIVNNTMPRPDLDNFLKRPIVVANVAWNSSATIGSNMGSYIFPDVLFTTTYMNKLEKIAFWRPDIEISIRMNGTPMHYGKLVFAWIPQASFLNAAYYTSYFSMFSNKWIQVSASANQTTVIRVPFTHYKEMITVGKTTPDLFTLFSFVSIPLSSVNGAPPSINYTIYARVVDPELIGYNYTTNWTTQSDFDGQKSVKQRVRSPNSKIPSEAESKTDDGKVVSSSVLSLGDAVSKFTWVPLIGGLAKSVGSGISAVGNVLKWFGLNTPPNLELTHPMMLRQPKVLQVEDCPTTLAIGPIADCGVAKDYALVNDTLDAASMLKFVQRPSLLYAGTITSSNAVGDILYSKWVNPTNMTCNDYSGAGSSASYVGTPLSYMAKFFLQWRGGMRVHISFIASHFHSCRVKVWYIPYVAGGVTALPTPTEIQTTDLINTIIDITEERDYSFTIPWCQVYEWANGIASFGAPGSLNDVNGCFGLTLINPLTSGAATVSTMYYQIFISAAADFQLAAPSMLNNQAVGGYFQTQGAFDVLECEIPSSSMQCLYDKEYPPIGNVAVGRTNHKTFQCIEITGIKQLTNMVAPLYSVLPSASGFNGELLFKPGGNFSMGSDITTAVANNWLTNMAIVFRYFRGSSRIVLRTASKDTIAFCRASFSASNSGTSYIITTTSTTDWNNVNFSSTPNLQQGNYQTGPLGVSPADFLLPWNLKYKCLPVIADLGGTSVSRVATESIYSPYLIMFLYNEDSALNYCSIHTGGGDDFLLGWQIGIPMFTSTVP